MNDLIKALTSLKTPVFFREALRLVVGFNFVLFLSYVHSKNLILGLNIYSALALLLVSYIFGRLLYLFGWLCSGTVELLFKKDRKDDFLSLWYFLRNGNSKIPSETEREILDRELFPEVLEYVVKNSGIQTHKEILILGDMFITTLLGATMVLTFLISLWWIVPSFVLLVLCIWNDDYSLRLNLEIQKAVFKTKKTARNK